VAIVVTLLSQLLRQAGWVPQAVASSCKFRNAVQATVLRLALLCGFCFNSCCQLNNLFATSGLKFRPASRLESCCWH
jgi:hypothetical protein